MPRPLHSKDANLYSNHVTWVTRWRVPHFTDLALGRACLEAIEHERRRMGLIVMAFALMPDHFHLVVAPTPMSIGKMVQALKAASVLRLMARGLTSGGLWQEDYFDVALRDERQLRTAIDYVHQNPGKEGLIQDSRRYTLSSYGAWEGLTDSLISIQGAAQLLSA